MQSRLTLAVIAASLLLGGWTGVARAQPVAHADCGCSDCPKDMTIWDKLRILKFRWRAHLDPNLTEVPGMLCPRQPEIPQLARYAGPSDNGRYVGGWVGGGCARGGGPPGPHDGTWGWDYWGFPKIRESIRRYPFLNWCWDGRYQGGTGAYNAQIPPCPPNVIIFSEKEGDHGPITNRGHWHKKHDGAGHWLSER